MDYNNNTTDNLYSENTKKLFEQMNQVKPEDAEKIRQQIFEAEKQREKEHNNARSKKIDKLLDVIKNADNITLTKLYTFAILTAAMDEDEDTTIKAIKELTNINIG